MAKPRLILHVGHPKTGTSAIQAALAQSVEALREHRICYLETRAVMAARKGRITSGNLFPAKLPRDIKRARRTAPDAEALLFSGENGFIGYGQHPEHLRRLVDAGWQPEIILFLRDPFEWAQSAYMQTVKRHGGAHSFSQFLRGAPFLERVERFINLCDDLGLSLKLRNYSRRRRTIVPEMERCLGLPRGTLQIADTAPVNRSLTRAEVTRLQEINRSFGRLTARLVSDALCEQLPHIPAEAPPLDPDVFQLFLDRSRPVAERVNERLAPEDVYHLPSDFEAWQASHTSVVSTELSPRQRNVIDTALVQAARIPFRNQQEAILQRLGHGGPVATRLRAVLNSLSLRG